MNIFVSELDRMASLREAKRCLYMARKMSPEMLRLSLSGSALRSWTHPHIGGIDSVQFMLVICYLRTR